MKKIHTILFLICACCLAPLYGTAQRNSITDNTTGWKSGDYNTSYRRQTFDFTRYITQSGNYTITFTFTSGMHLLAGRNAVIEVDGKEVASFPKEVSAGLKPRSWTYTFNVQSKPRRVKLMVDLRTDGGNDSNGKINVVRNGSATRAAAKLDGDYNFYDTGSSNSTTTTTRRTTTSSPSSNYTTTTTTTTTYTTTTYSSSSSTPQTVTYVSTVTSPFNDVVMNWKSGDYTTNYQRKTFDFTKYVTQSGNYTITFTYTGGSHMLASRNAVIEVDGKEIASFPKEVSAGFNPRSWKYTFNVSSKPRSVKLIADIRTDGGTNSSGNISVIRNGSATRAAATLDGDWSAFAKGNSGSSGSSSSYWGSSSASPAQSGKTKWEKKSAPIKIPNELIIYNKNSSLVRSAQRKEVVKFKDQPKVVEYTTGDITRPEKYINDVPYPVNEDAKREDRNATRNDRLENGTLYIADGTTTIYKNAYNGRKDIYTVVLPESVKTIGDYAFANMPNLTTVKGPNYKIKYIGDHAFDQDMNLTSVPSTYELKYLGRCSFRETALKKATNVQAYFVGDSAFLGSAVETAGWTSIKAIGDYAFKDCKNLKEWDFFDGEGYGVSLEYVGHGAFLGTNITNVHLQEGTMVGMEAFEPNTEITWNLNLAKCEEKVRPQYKIEEFSSDLMPEMNYFQVVTPADYDPVTDVDMPMILYLHGRSMSLDEPPATEYGPLQAMNHGYKIFEHGKAILVLPRALSKEGWSSVKLHKLYEFMKAHYAFDHNRFYVTGLSMGGWGTLNYVTRYPEEVAACVAFCGGCDTQKPCGLNQVPTWIVHAKDDDVTSVTHSDRVVEAMKKCGSTNLLKYSRLEQGGHSLIYYYDYCTFYDWLLAHNRKSRTFNHTYDFIDDYSVPLDEDAFWLGAQYYEYDYTEITSELLSTIKARTPNAQGSPIPPKVKPEEPQIIVEPITRIPTGRAATTPAYNITQPVAATDNAPAQQNTDTKTTKKKKRKR